MRGQSLIRHVAVGWTFLAAMPLIAKDTDKKVPVPAAAAQAESMKLIKEVYGDEWAAARTSSQKQALAKKLLQKGIETEKDLPARFALLKLSRDIAALAPDCPTAFRAIDELDEKFQVDALEMKAAVLTKLTSMARLADQHKAIAEKAAELLQAAVAEDNFTMAKQFADLALGEAAKAKDKSLAARIEDRTAEINKAAQAFEAASQAMATLEKSPADPAANLVVGKYKCFVKGDWDAGIPMLALGSDDALKGLATQEIKGAASSHEQAALGDRWWELADKQEGTAKMPLQARAGYWYQKALPGLAGLMKGKVEKRLGELVSPIADGAGTETRVRIVNRNSGMCLGIQNGGEAGNQAVVQQPLSPDALDHQWRIERVQNSCAIVNVKSGSCLAVSEGKKTAGHAIIVWPKADAALEQQWQIKPLGRAYCTIVNRNSGLCLSIGQGAKTANAGACQWPFSGAKAWEQQWRIEVIPPDGTKKPR